MKLHSRPCPVCSSNDRAVLCTSQSRAGEVEPPVTADYVSCGGCGLIYLHPAPDLASLNEAYQSMPEGTRGQTKGTRFLDKLETTLSPVMDSVEHYHTMPHEQGNGRRILDVGCGDARKLEPFHARGWSVHGIDVGKSLIEDARTRIPHGEFKVGTLHEGRYPGGHFDCVRIDNVLEHVLDPVGVLAEIHRILKPGGRLYVYVPNGESFTMKKLPQSSVSNWVPYHLTLFTERSLRDALARAGFARTATVKRSTPIPWLYGALKLRFTKQRSLTRGMSIPEKVVAAAMLTPAAWMLNATPQGEELVTWITK